MAQKLRYFTLDVKPVRALPYQQDLLGTNITRLADQNIFVRKIPKDLVHEDLEKAFSKYGEIKSCKVSMNEDHTSRSYGFVCFKDAEPCARALSETSNRDSIIGVKFAPKNKSDFRKAFNNIYIKNIPDDWKEPEIRKHFSAFGKIQSLFTGSNEFGMYAFVCYGNDDPMDREYGPNCAREACDKMNGATFGDKQLYVKEALKRSDRDKVLAHETLKYKTSKKRCNLFVKNFDPNTTEDDLRNLFSAYGEIESLRLFKAGDGKNPHAFVCFKTPDVASAVKNQELSLNSKPLYISHYEMKQQREIQNESAKDKQDFQRYQAENLQNFDYQSYEQISSILRLLMHSMKGGNQGAMQGQLPMGGRAHSQGHQGGNMGQGQGMHQGHGGHQQHRNNYRDQRHGGNNQNNRGYNQQPRQPPQPQPMPAPGQPSMPMPSAIQSQVAFAPSQDPQAAELYRRVMPIYNAINEINPNYKNQVGTTIFDFVLRQVGQETAPKITGMLIDLPIHEIQRYLTNFEHFVNRVQQAHTMLMQQTAAVQQ